MHRTLRSLRRGEGGQALVELALSIPLLLFVLFAIVDFGLAINAENSDTNLANLAAREVSVIGTATSASCNGVSYTTLTTWVVCEAQQTAPSLPTPTSVCVGDTGTATPNTTYAQGDQIEVKIAIPFNWLGIITNGVGKVGGIGGLTTSISQGASARLETAAAGSTFLGTTACST